MNYTWRIFKFSKLINNNDDYLSHCKKNIEEFSQSIVHSQFDSQGIIREQWLHIFMESNRSIEVSIVNGSLEIVLNIYNPPNISVIILEKINDFKSMKMCLRGRVLAFKCLQVKKKFQIVFFNSDESNAFLNKFNSSIDCNKEDENSIFALRNEFLSYFKDEISEGFCFDDMKTNESKDELIRKFIKLVRE